MAMRRRMTVGGMLLMLLMLVAGYADAFIAPQEIPSILSLVYSNIPPVKKGTDSRVGFGYRLGEHADFQVVFELGPQTETKPLGGSPTFGNDNGKRQVNQDDYVDIKPTQKSPNPVGSKWLNNWSQDMRVQQQRRPSAATNAPSRPDQNVVPVQTMPFISESALRQLQQLYGRPLPAAQDEAKPEAAGTLPAASMDAVVAQLNKVRYGNSVVPKAPAQAKRNTAKITADLMDIDLT